MIKKHMLVLSTLALMIGSCAFITSCGEEPPKPYEEQTYDIPEDVYPLASEQSVGQKIFKIALNGIGSGIKSGPKAALTSIVTDLGSWAAKGIAKQLGFSWGNETSYFDQVSTRLDNIEGEIKELDTKVDWLVEKVDDSKYLNTYNAFMAEYDALNKKVFDCWQLYSDIESKIKDTNKESTEQEIEKLLDSLCENIRNGETGLNELDIHAAKFGQSFLSTSTKVPELNKYGIFYIIERFVNKQTPFIDNRYKEFAEITADFLTAFYHATILANLEYNRTLQKHGIVKYVMSSDDTIVSYTYKNNGEEVTKMNCRTSSRDSYIEKYKNSNPKAEELAAFENLECMPLIDYNEGVVAQFDHRIENTTRLYNNVAKLLDKFLERYKVPEGERHLMYEDGSLQKTSLEIKAVQPKNFLSWDKKAKSFEVKYSKFGNIKKDEFVKYAETILPHAKVIDERGKKVSLTFRQFFEREGYVFPETNKSNFLLLGADKKSVFTSKNDLYNNGYKYENMFSVYTIDIDINIESFVKKNEFEIFNYGTYTRKDYNDSGCAVSFDYPVFAIESRGKKEGSDIHDRFKLSAKFDGDWNGVKPTIFYTIFDLSTKPLKSTESYKTVRF